MLTKYEEARKALWEALEFKPEDGSKEGDLYRVNRVTFEDETEPKVLLKKMLGKQPTAATRRNVLDAVLGRGHVLGLSSISDKDSKFSKITKALYTSGAWKNGTEFIKVMVPDPTDPEAKKNKETRNNFKLLLKEYLKKATQRTFSAQGRDLHRGDRILCCLLLLHYMTKDKKKLDVEIEYDPDALSSDKERLIDEAKILKSCRDLNGVKDYFTRRKKLEYYDVVLPSGWTKGDDPDFVSIKKRKNDIEQLSTQYFDIAYWVNTVSTPKDRLQITKFFVAANRKDAHYWVFADGADVDDAILTEIENVLFDGARSVNPIASASDKNFITEETVNGLADSIKKFDDIFVFSQLDGRTIMYKTEELQENVKKLSNKDMSAFDDVSGKTYLRLLRDYERIIEQMTMLKSLPPDQRTDFLRTNAGDVEGMLNGEPLSRELVDELKELNREANSAQIAEFAQSPDGELKLRSSIYSMGQKLQQAKNNYNFMQNAAYFYRIVASNYGHYYNLLARSLTNHTWTQVEIHLWNFFLQSGCNNNVDLFMQKLGFYSNTQNPNGTIVFKNKKAQDDYDNCNKIIKEEKKLEEQSKRLQSQMESLNALKEAINHKKDYNTEILPKFKECISEFYDFSGDKNERREKSKMLQELMYDKETGKLSQMMKDLAKEAKEVKTVTGAELRRKAAKATPTKPDISCANYVTVAVKEPILQLNNTNQKYIPGDETLKRCTNALEKIGLKPTDVLHILGTASQTNGCESMDTNHATLDKQILDRTQGPTQNRESFSGTIKREIMYEDGKLKDFDTAKPLIDKLAEMRVIKRADDPPSDKDIGRWVPTDMYYNGDVHIYVAYDKYGNPTKEQEKLKGKFAFYSNGYIQPDTLNKDGESKLMEAMASVPCLYMSQDNESNDGKQEFTQNFAAAFSYQGSSAREFDEQDNPIFNPKQIIMNFMWIYPQYDNIIKDAIIKSAGNPEKKIVMVHMPGIGQGAFGNPKGLTELALILAIIVNINKLTGSNIIFQRESMDVLNPGPAIALCETLKKEENLYLFNTYANKVDKNLAGALQKFNNFSHLIEKRAIAFGYLDTNGKYVIPAQTAPQGNNFGQPQFGNNFGQQQNQQQQNRPYQQPANPVGYGQPQYQQTNQQRFQQQQFGQPQQGQQYQQYQQQPNQGRYGQPQQGQQNQQQQ